MTPRPTATRGYRARLAQQLELVGPTALEMLAETTPVDPTLLMAALEAATLLSDHTTPTAVAPLRAQVLREVERSSVVDRLVREHLSPAPLDWPDHDPLEREARVQELVALAGLRTLVSSSERWRLDHILDDATASFELYPESFADLAEVAIYLDDELDLAPSHTVSAFLDALRLTAVVADEPIEEAAFEAAFQAARASVSTSDSSTLATKWSELWAGFGQRVRQLVEAVEAQPALALAADGSDETAVPRERIVLWRGDGRGELNLVAADHELQVEWFGQPGDASPDRVELVDLVLQEVESPLLGARLWRVPKTPPNAPFKLVLSFGDDQVRVQAREVPGGE
jgi:hypothetical protein